MSYAHIFNSLRESVARFPNCRIANCDCNSKEGFWNAGCRCLCHLRQMDQIKPQWSLTDFQKQSETGYQPTKSNA